MPSKLITNSIALLPEEIPVSEQLNHWRALMGRSATAVALPAGETWRLTGPLEIFKIVDAEVVHSNSTGFEYHRSAVSEKRSKNDTVAITFCCEGELILTYNGDFVVRANAGQLVVANPDVDLRVIAESSARYFTMYLHKPAMLTATGLSEVFPAIEVPIQSSVRQLLVSMFGELIQNLRVREELVSSSLMKSIEVLVDQLSRPLFIGRAEIEEDRMLEIQTFVDENVRNPELGVKLLCDEFKISRATLYRQMQHVGGVKQYLQSRRLVRCFDDVRKSGESDDGYLRSLVKPYNFKSLKDFVERYRKQFGVDPMQLLETDMVSTFSSSAEGEIFRL